MLWRGWADRLCARGIAAGQRGRVSGARFLHGLVRGGGGIGGDGAGGDGASVFWVRGVWLADRAGGALPLRCGEGDGRQAALAWRSVFGRVVCGHVAPEGGAAAEMPGASRPRTPTGYLGQEEHGGGFVLTGLALCAGGLGWCGGRGILPLRRR